MELAIEKPDDWWEVEALYDLCFAPGREALSSYRLRDGVEPVAGLCMVARDEADVLAAAIRYWPVRVGDAQALLLGPIAVHPTHQGEGLGGWLMIESMQAARALGWKRVILVGDAPYYSRFGFQVNRQLKMPPPTNPERLMTAELVAGAWVGIAGPVMRVVDA